MRDFLMQLFESGEILVTRKAKPDAGYRQLLAERERLVRADFPGSAPAFDLDTADRAAQVLLLFCQATVYRELDAADVQLQLQNIQLSASDSSSCQYSADLTLQFLPQILSRLQRRNSSDPVAEQLKRLLFEWPLSSVGIPDSHPGSLPSALTTPPLLQAYVDRIIVRQAADRLADDLIASHVRSAIEAYPHLAPKLVASLS